MASGGTWQKSGGRTLVAAGVEFINADQSGVRLKRRDTNLESGGGSHWKP